MRKPSTFFNKIKKENVTQRELTSLEKIANKLHNSVRANFPEKYRIKSVNAWCEILAKLMETYGERHIRETVNYFIHNIKEDFIPVINKPSLFLRNFNLLHTLTWKSVDTGKRLTQEELELVEKLKSDLNWKGDMLSKLPFCVEQNLVNYDKFYRKYSKFKETIQNNRLKKFCAFLEESSYITSSKPHFVRSWMLSIANHFSTWEDYEPKITPYLFSINSDYFIRIGVGWSHNYCNAPDLWYDLIKEVKYTKVDVKNPREIVE